MRPFDSELGLYRDQPVVGMEGRAPLHEQTVTRQTYLPAELAKKGIQTVYVLADNPEIYSGGKITNYSVYDGQDNRNVQLSSKAGITLPTWRLRDVSWEDGDPPAYRAEGGYNSPPLRAGLQTRPSIHKALTNLGLGSYTIESHVVTDNESDSSFDGTEVEEVFVKPLEVKDVGKDKPGKPARARLVAGRDALQVIAEEFDGNAVIQEVQPVISANELTAKLGIDRSGEEFPDGTLHAVRVHNPHWLAYDNPSAVEVRISTREDVGELFATEVHLVEPEQAFNRLPELARAHEEVHSAMNGQYDRYNNPAVDYIVSPGGNIYVSSVLARPLTPNLEQTDSEQARLALVTADVEVKKLTELAYEASDAEITIFNRTL